MENKKALFYARVSTVSAEQETSIESQIDLCREFLSNNPEYCLADPIETYVEKVSGKTDLRDRYDALMKRIATSDGDIQYIIVKDLYRLSRSAEVSSGIKRFCKNYGVKLVLLANKGNEEYDPSEEQNRLLYGIQSLLAEEYVYNQSKLARLSHAQKMEAKRLNRNNVVFGYKWDYDAGDMVVDEGNIEIVKRVYEWYVFQGLGEKKIKEKLMSEYNIRVSSNTIRKWLTDSSYIGSFSMNKTTSVLGVGKGDKTHRYRNNPSEYVIVNRPDLKTIDERLFILAQEIRARRKSDSKEDINGIKQGRFKGTSLFASKIICDYCKNHYYFKHSDRNSKYGIYKCSDGLKKNSIQCINEYNRIDEADMIRIITKVINEYMHRNKALNPQILSVIRKNISIQDNEKEIDRIKKDLNKSYIQIEKYREAYINEKNPILKADLQSYYLKLKEDTDILKERLVEEEGKQNKVDAIVSIENRLKMIEHAMNKMIDITDLNRNIINSFIDKISIKINGDIDVIINGLGSSLNEKIELNESIKSQVSKESIKIPLFDITYTFNVKNRIIRKPMGYMSKKPFEVCIYVYISL